MLFSSLSQCIVHYCFLRVSLEIDSQIFKDFLQGITGVDQMWHDVGGLLVGDGEWQLAVDTGQQKRPVSMRGSSSSEGRPVKMSRHSSWFVEFPLEIHVSVSPQGMQCHLLALELTQALLFICSFLLLPWLYFLCCKEMWYPYRNH